MPRHEQAVHTHQRRELLHYLTLMERAFREAREYLALGDELTENSRSPKLIVGARLAENGANPQAEMQANAAQMFQVAIAQINDGLALGTKLMNILNKKEPPPETNGASLKMAE